MPFWFRRDIYKFYLLASEKKTMEIKLTLGKSNIFEHVMMINNILIGFSGDGF